MSRKEPLLHIANCQFKSIEKLRLLAKTLDTMEKEFGIREVRISFENCFVCPDIDLTKLTNSKKPMERIVGNILIKIDILKHGKKSLYSKAK